MHIKRESLLLMSSTFRKEEMALMQYKSMVQSKILSNMITKTCLESIHILNIEKKILNDLEGWFKSLGV